MQGRSAIQGNGGERVPETVRTDLTGDACFVSEPLDGAERFRPVPWPACCGREDRQALVCCRYQVRSGRIQIGVQRISSGSRHGDLGCFAALAAESQGPVSRVVTIVSGAHTENLADTDAGEHEQADQGMRARSVRSSCTEQGFGLIPRESLRCTVIGVHLWTGDQLHRVGLYHFHAQRVLIEAGQCRELARHCGRGTLPVLGHGLRVDTKLVSDRCPIDCGETASISSGGRSLHCHLLLQTDGTKLGEKLVEDKAGVGFLPHPRTLLDVLQVPGRGLAVFRLGCGALHCAV